MRNEIPATTLMKALEDVGFDRKLRRGSHLVMGHRSTGGLVTLPTRGSIPPGILRSIVRQVSGLGITSERQFLSLLEPQDTTKRKTA